MSVAIGERRDGGEYVDVHGVPTWHLHTGNPAGPATVLVHSVFASSASWAAQILDFGDNGLDLYAPERVGHGHTPDSDEPFTMEGTARHLIAYLETVVRRPAHIITWSEAAVAALLVARERPDLVNKLVLVCGYINSDAVDKDEFIGPLIRRDPGIVGLLSELFTAFTPDGRDHFETYLSKCTDLMIPGPDHSPEDFSTVRAPTLVLSADMGGIDIDHTLELSRALPAGRLAVLPGTHYLPVESPEVVNPLVLSFLAAEPPTAWNI
ncbi:MULTISPECIES: alpha/beta fold hydrolase [Gordonia]|nr:alpha/beta hydrolase [Gordonia pseudamarae]